MARRASKKVPWDHPSSRSPSPSYKTLPVFRIIPPQPANFLSRKRERERVEGESLSAFPTFPRKKENAPREGKKGRGKLCRPREKRIQKLGRIIFRSALSTVYTTNTSPSLFFLQRENRELFFFKFPRSDDAQASLSLLPPKRGGNVVCAPFLPEKQGRVINDPLYPGN